MKSLKNRKSPCLGSLTYDNWIALDTRLVPFIVRGFIATFISRQFDAEWFQFYEKSLSKKPGKHYLHPISLFNSVVKIMDRLLVFKLLH
jgi:hypothetical protein